MKKAITHILSIVSVIMLSISPIPKVNAIAASGGAETAVISKNEVPLETRVRTSGGDSMYGLVSPISDFIDPNGIYTIAYASNKKVFISHINNKLEISDTITIKKPMPKIGGVCCDKGGNFYIACGQEDKKKILGSMTTFAIYKYSPSGKQLGKCENTYKIKKKVNSATLVPFRSGNCVMTFQGNVLICSYAKKMYNGHQANEMFCVDTTTMKENRDYYSLDTYVSHCFFQSVLVTEGVAPCEKGKVILADLGDGYPRGIHISILEKTRVIDDETGLTEEEASYTESIPFHFYGKIGDFFTHASLTGIGELDKGIALVGSSAKSMTANASKEGQQMFIQMLDITTGKPLLSASTRSGTCVGKKYTDTGIVWLTNYKNISVGGSAMTVIDKDKVLVMWEKLDKNGNFVSSYYSIVRSDGKILKNAIPMQNARINGTEELKYKDGYVTWIHSSRERNIGSDATVYQMNVNKTITDNILNADVTLDEKLIYEGIADYTGKPIKPSVKVTYDGKKLNKGTDYTVSYSNNRKIGVAKINITGKGKYKGTLVQKFHIGPPEIKKITGKHSNGKVKLSWKKSTGADGYEVLIIKSGFAFTSALYNDNIKTTIKKTSKTSYSEKLRQSKQRTYYIRPYKDVKGVRIYGEWSQPVLSVEMK